MSITNLQYLKSFIYIILLPLVADNKKDKDLKKRSNKKRKVPWNSQTILIRNECSKNGYSCFFDPCGLDFVLNPSENGCFAPIYIYL